MLQRRLGLAVIVGTLIVGFVAAFWGRGGMRSSAVDLSTVPPQLSGSGRLDAVDGLGSLEGALLVSLFTAGDALSECSDSRRLRANPSELVACLAALDQQMAADREAVRLLKPERQTAPRSSLTDARVYQLSDGRRVAFSEWKGASVEQFDLNGDGIYDAAQFDDPQRPGPDLVFYDINADTDADFCRGDVYPFNGRLDENEVFSYEPSRGWWTGAVDGAKPYFSMPANRFPVQVPTFPFPFFYLG